MELLEQLVRPGAGHPAPWKKRLIIFDDGTRARAIIRRLHAFVEILMGCRRAESSARRQRSPLTRFSSFELKILLAIAANDDGRP